MAFPTISVPGDYVSDLSYQIKTELKQYDRCARTVTDGKGKVLLAPSSADGVDVAAADTAALDLDVDVVVTEGLGLEFVLVEFKPCVGSVDLEAGELLWVRHLWLFGGAED